jgi:hypothetical protein
LFLQSIDKSTDLLGGFSLGAERGEETGDLGGGRITADYLVHRPG